MRRKQEKSIPTVFICSIIAGVVLLTGCYLKQKPPGSLTANQNVNGPQKVLRNHWDQFFSEVKKVDSRAKAHYDMGVYFQKKKKQHFALQEFQKAIQFNPTDAKTYNAMGISYDKSGDYEQAIQCYEMAIKLNPEMASAYNNLGYSKMLKGDPEGAIVAYQKAIELDDTNPRYRNNLGSLYAKSGRVEQAREQFEVKDDPSAADRKLDRLLGKSADNETPQKRTVLSDIFETKPENVTNIEPQNDNTRHVGQLKTLEVNADANSNIEADDPDRRDISEPDDSVVVIVYDNELVQPEVSDSDRNPSVVAEIHEERGTFENDIESKYPEPIPERQDTDDSAEVALYAVNITTKTQILPLYEYEQNKKIEENEVLEELPRETATQPDVVEVVFRNEQKPTADIEKKTTTKRTAQTTKGNKAHRPRENQLSYESIRIIEVESPRESNSQLLLAGLKLVDKSEQNAKADIEVSNGNGTRGAARRLATDLNAKGFKVSKVSNARSFDHLSTKVLYRTENMDFVFPLLNELPLLVEDSDLIENGNMKTSIRIIIGKDFAGIR